LTAEALDDGRGNEVENFHKDAILDLLNFNLQTVRAIFMGLWNYRNRVIGRWSEIEISM
jgi:hypothetical protein